MKNISYSFAGNWQERVKTRRSLRFPMPAGVTKVVLTAHEARLARNGDFSLLEVVGDQLERFGICRGDRLICERVASPNEISTPGFYVAKRCDAKEEVVVKIEIREGRVIALDCDSGDRLDDIEIDRAVVHLLRDPDASGDFRRKRHRH